ncbi:MAG: hypothetical protein U0414_03445 [Polyangiaceae bacterium]
MSSSTPSIELQCVKCGAALPIDGSTQTPTCRYCNAQTLVPEHLWRRFRPVPVPAPAQVVVVAPWAAPPRTGAWIGLAVGAVAAIGAVVAVLFVVAGTAKAPRPGTQSTGKVVKVEPAPPPSPVAALGDRCEGRKAACSTDKTRELTCGKDERMEVAMTCKGPNGCRVDAGGDSISCDTTLADADDPCSGDDSACSTDHHRQLRCQAGKFAITSTCKGPDGCTLTPKSGGYTLSCDDHVADVGDPCFDAKRVACSSDKKSFLTCTAQRFAVDRACPKGCDVKKVAGTDQAELACK